MSTPRLLGYPGHIRPGKVSPRMWSTIDVLPTLAHLAGAALPKNEIDGRNVWDLLTGRPGAANPREYYAFSTGPNFEGVISGDGKWKLHVPHNYRVLVEAGNDGAAGKYTQASIGLSLFDMENDPNETTNLVDRFPDVAKRLQGYADSHRARFYSS